MYKIYSLFLHVSFLLLVSVLCSNWASEFKIWMLSCLRVLIHVKVQMTLTHMYTRTHQCNILPPFGDFLNNGVQIWQGTSKKENDTQKWVLAQGNNYTGVSQQKENHSEILRSFFSSSHFKSLYKSGEMRKQTAKV